MTTQRDRRVAIHEAGHAVVADALGLIVCGIEGTEDNARVAILADRAMPASEHLLHVAVCHAGFMAEQRWDAEATPHPGLVTDQLDADEHAQVYATEHDVAVDDVHVKGMKLARMLLKSRWPVVLDVAEAFLANDRFVSGQELRVLCASDDPKVGHVETLKWEGT